MTIQGKPFEFCPCGQPRDAEKDFWVHGSTVGLTNRTQLTAHGKLRDTDVNEFSGFAVRACRACAVVYVDMSPVTSRHK